MEKDNKGVSLDEFIYRKLQPVRILRGYLNNELELAEGDTIRMSRIDLDNIVSTIEIFLEEYDRVSSSRRSKSHSERKKTTFLDSKPQAIKTIA
ncbi:MAG: hypothetical protein L3J82_10625 [Planctomycetes bacterium]|nr:hypothetical protein [Planctomycetota bacterium]